MTDVLGTPAGGYISEYANGAGWDPVNNKFRFCGAEHGTQYQARCVEYTDSDNTFREMAWAPGTCQQLAGCPYTPFNHAFEHNTTDQTTGTSYFAHYGHRTIRR